jgi:hypothetical protein
MTSKTVNAVTRLSHEPFRNAYSCVLVTKALVRYAASIDCRMNMHESRFVRQPLTRTFGGGEGTRTLEPPDCQSVNVQSDW